MIARVMVHKWVVRTPVELRIVTMSQGRPERDGEGWAKEVRRGTMKVILLRNVFLE
jgi:hypothetical protein